MEMAFSIRSHQKATVTRQCQCFDAVGTAPVVHHLAVQVPLAEVPFLVETSGDKRLSVTGPGAGADRLLKPADCP